MKRLCLLYFISLSGMLLYAQDNISVDTFRIMSYNVENLFDCKHDSLKKDYEFLPDATRKWTPNKYRQKLKHLSQTIAACGGEQLPDLIGLCEVENQQTMIDLTRFSPLKTGGYHYLITDSPDERGIDVALLYQPERFQVLHREDIRIPSVKSRLKPTRDILYVTGKLITSDTLDVFVCHLPSRAGGSRLTHPFRCLVATLIKQKIDSLINIRKSPRIVLMGDFNEYPNKPLFTEVLQAKNPLTESLVSAKHLYNMMHEQPRGTYRFQGEWGIFDHILVSGLLLNEQEDIYTRPSLCRIQAHPFLLKEDERYGGYTPFRTYHGMKYQGGYSDHLPVTLILLMPYSSTP